jgi:sporulation-control protein spo0M
MKLEKDKNIEDAEIKELMRVLDEVGLGTNLRLSVQFAINSNDYLYTNSDVLVQNIKRVIKEVGIEVKHYEVADVRSFKRKYRFIIEGPETGVDKFHQTILGLSWIDGDSQEILEKKYY